MKKVLIITYYWPPSGGGGVQRWLKFSKYLPEFGWQPIVFTPENPDFSIKDPSLLNDISQEVEVLKFPIWEPYSIFDKISGKRKESSRRQGVVEGENDKSFLTNVSKWIRGNLFIPDPKVSWVGPSVSFLTTYIKEQAIDAIITTGPPHSMHLIGMKLKKRTGIAWIADFRDPWVHWDMMKNFNISWPVRKIHRRLEAAVVKWADRVINVSRSWAAEMSMDHGKEIRTITNGFDPDDFINRPVINGEKFILSHSGLINAFRNPAILWKALEELCAENKEFNDALQIEFCGTIDNKIQGQIESNAFLAPKYSYRGYLSHDDVLKVYYSSSALILLLNESENAKGHLPGKLFEYLAANRFILALGPTDGDASKILSETETGQCCHPDDVQCIKKVLTSFFTHFKNGNFPNSDRIEKYSRKVLTRQLVDVLEEI